MTNAEIIAVATQTEGKGELAHACLLAFTAPHSGGDIAKNAAAAAFRHDLMTAEGSTFADEESESGYFWNTYSIRVPETDFALLVEQDGSGKDTYAVRHPILGRAKLK